VTRPPQIAGLSVPGPVPALVGEVLPPAPVNGKLGNLAAIIAGAIDDGRWPAGSRLPAERTLAATYAVSRETVRAALAALAAAGRIRRQGRATVVATSSVQVTGAAPPRLRVALVLIPERLRNPLIQATVDACRDRLGPGIALNLFLHERVHPEHYRRMGAGLVFVDGAFGPRAIAAIDTAGLPVAVINAFHASWPYACTDHRLGGMLMARHAVELGHRRIAVLHQYGRRIDDFIQRLRGIRHELLAAGLHADEIELPVEPESLRVFGLRLLALLRASRPTVLLCLTDGIALRVLETLDVAGIAVPGEVGIIGYDDTPAGAMVRPRLTTVRQPVAELGAALAAIARRTADGLDARLDRPISPVLVQRDSVADLRPRSLRT
jgi:DNA-binding LacI/PurR family transcriptional regulator